MRRLGLALAGVGALGVVWCGCHSAQTAPGLSGPDTAKLVEGDGGVRLLPAGMVEPAGSLIMGASHDGAGMDGGAAGPSVVELPAPPKTVKLYIRSSPPKASVTWGKKTLGLTPVTIERPYNSGPMDLIVRKKDYLPVHTRAYSFRSDSLYVQMTKIENQGKLLGARQAPVAPNPDGGVPPPVATTSPVASGGPAAPGGPVAPGGPAAPVSPGAPVPGTLTPGAAAPAGP